MKKKTFFLLLALLLLLCASRLGLHLTPGSRRELRGVARAALCGFGHAVCGLDADVVVLVLRSLLVRGGTRQLREF